MMVKIMIFEKLREIKELRCEIEACQDDKLAILLQQQLIELLKDTFKDKELMTEIMLKNSLKKQKE